jgi:UDP-N-acetylmuramate dehydrogenase
MIFQENISLKPYNTFGIDASAKYFTEISSIEELKELINNPKFKHEENLVLGGGSNILLTQNFNGLIIKNSLKGLETTLDNNEQTIIKVGAGENWHEFVIKCVNENLAGIENLSLIPGCVGASPMQNIGAYGVEIKDVFHELEAIHKETGELIKFSKDECKFGYRESVFKNIYKNQFVITNVSFKLEKRPHYNIEYGAIKQELDKMQVSKLNIKAISQAVINIRQSKLPNPKDLGNAGSFFKNPEVSGEKHHQLKSQFPDLVSYPLENQNHKLAAGWLIEQCGLKGYRLGDAGVHKLQSLVLINYGLATGKEIYDLSSHILNQVSEKFGVILEREVNII